MIAAVLIVVGCRVKDPLYCATNADCNDVAGRPYCDLTGQYDENHIRNTCVPDPSGGGSDGGVDSSGDHVVMVTLAGDGTGTVTSDPAGLTCTSGTCVATFPAGASVTLHATPDAAGDPGFDGFTGACTTQADCTLTLQADAMVTATFRKPWTVQFDLGVTGGKGSTAIAASPDGSLFVGGGIDLGNAWVRSMTPDGATKWDDNYGDVGTTVLAAVAQGTGKFVVGGTEKYQSDSRKWLRQYTANGVPEWTVTPNDSATNQQEHITGIGVDSNSNVIAVGTAPTGTSTPPQMWLAKYDTLGKPVWTKTVDNANEFGVYRVVVLPDDTMVTCASMATDFVLQKRDPSGNVLWTVTEPNKSISDCTRDPSGNFWAAVLPNHVEKFNSGGTQVLDLPVTTDQIDGIAADSRGNIYLTGQSGIDIWMAQLHNNGSIGWVRTANPASYVASGQAVTTDADDNVIFLGAATVSQDPNMNMAIWVRKYYE